MLRILASSSSIRQRVAGRHTCRLNSYGLSSYGHQRCKSAVAAAVDEEGNHPGSEIRRLTHLRNVGILAHVDAGKTTLTERMLVLAGVVRRAGSVDDGNTVTDYLPAERERGITIQSAAISFEWGWHNNRTGDDYDANDNVNIHLIDTPGHIDFSVEVNRSVAVLDGAVLVVDAVAGVQAQTETVWRAMTRPSLNNHKKQASNTTPAHHGHEPLPCLALINKMDKEGCHFGNAISSLRNKLSGANPIAMQIPLFQVSKGGKSHSLQNLVAVPVDEASSPTGEFVGIVDLIHMRAVVWPDSSSATAASVENCLPKVINLLKQGSHEPVDAECNVTQTALAARGDFVASLADMDERIEEYFLNEEEPSNAELRTALRRATVGRKALPVMATAALRGKGIEPLLDAIADLLPSPLDRMPPALIQQGDSTNRIPAKTDIGDGQDGEKGRQNMTLGHPLHPSLLALAFKVVHMKGRGGSGDGRVVFARVYSGHLRAKDSVKVISPNAPGEAPEKPRMERIGGMLELAGGRFDNLEDGFCNSGDVCALVGLKTVVTGDTILLASDDHGGSSNGKKGRGKKNGKKVTGNRNVCLAGVASPKPVLTVRVEAESAEEQAKLSDALSLLTIEDPSLHVEETESSTLMSGLGELHIEISLDRLRREFGLEVRSGSPAVAYRETIADTIETRGLLEYDRTVGGTRLQAAVQLVLRPLSCPDGTSVASSCMVLSDPLVTVGPEAREFLEADECLPEEELAMRCDVVRALISGCKGALKRGPLGSYALANICCEVVDVDAEGGFKALAALPGSLRAAAASAVSAVLYENHHNCSILEPTMSVEVTAPGDMVGTVLSDLTGRRGTVGDVIMGDGASAPGQTKALICGEVPLVEILGYASCLRSLTGGEGAFTAEYKGHSPCDKASMV